MFNCKIGTNEFKTEVPLFGAYMQHSFILSNGYTAELSGSLNGPSIWGAIWKTRSLGGLDIGIQ